MSNKQEMFLNKPNLGNMKHSDIQDIKLVLNMTISIYVSKLVSNL